MNKKTIWAIILVACFLLMPAHAVPAMAASISKLDFKTYEKTYKASGVIYKQVSYEYPVAEGDSEAAAAFNRFYQKQLKKWKKNSKENLTEAKELVLDMFKDSGIYYSDQVKCEDTTLDERYVSILQSGYDYTLGAHGMPYRYSYIFDAQTGKRVKAAHILGMSKKQVNETVWGLYVKKYKKNKDLFGFYDNQEAFQEAVKKIDFAGGGEYYLKNGKIHFYVEPYALAPYAAGFIEVSVKL